MKAEIKDVTEANLDDIPETCRRCLYWSFPEKSEKTRAEQSKYIQESETQKKQWILQTLKESGTCAKILYYNNVPVGYAEYGPSNRFPQIKEYKSQPVGKIEDGVVFLSCLHIADRNLRRRGLGAKLLDNIIAYLKRRGFKAVETFARRGSPNNPSGPVELYSKKGFHTKNKNNPEFPIVRLNLQSQNHP